MSQTLQASAQPTIGVKWATLGDWTGVRLAWRWLVNEKQIATESLFCEDFQDTQWQETQWVRGAVDVPVERYDAV
jgi:hypothetical protein